MQEAAGGVGAQRGTEEQGQAEEEQQEEQQEAAQTPAEEVGPRGPGESQEAQDLSSGDRTSDNKAVMFLVIFSKNIILSHIK